VVVCLSLTREVAVTPRRKVARHTRCFIFLTSYDF
jgi:hypothetical protein